MADLKGVLDNVDRELNPEPAPEVARFAPQKLRGQTLQSLVQTARKLTNDSADFSRQLEDYMATMKAAIG